MSHHCVRFFASVCLATVLTAFQLLFAESEHKWGKVTPEEWAMTPPADFPHAPAIAIFEIGSLKIGSEIKYETHVRRKIFNRQASSDLIDIQITVSTDHNFGGFAAQTILPNGKKSVFNSLNLLKKKISDYFEVYSFSFPGVEDGCIVELKYHITARRTWFLPSWHFQNEYFTGESQFSFATDPDYIFNSVLIGLDDSLHKPVESEVDINHRPTKQFTWTVRNIPPLAEEPLQGASLNFRPSIYFQLSGYKTWFGASVTLSSDWPNMQSRLNEYYDRKLMSNDTLVAILDSLVGGAKLSAETEIMKVHAFVRDAITVSAGDFRNAVPSQKTTTTLERRAGTAVDKNLLLVEMLRILKFDADPLLTATREHARFTTNILHTEQFNYVLCHIRIGSTVYILDAASDEFPFPHVPPAVRAEAGLLLSDTAPRRTISFSSDDSVATAPEPVDTLSISYPAWTSGVRNNASIWLREDGSALCSAYVTVAGYQQSMLGPGRKAEANSELVSKLLVGLNQKNFDVAEITRVDSDDTDSTSFKIVLNISDFSTLGGGLLACLPSLIWSGEHSFGSPTRQFPVDFRFTRYHSETIDLHLPENYSLATVPGNFSDITSDLLFSRAVLHDDRTARIMTNMMIKRVFFPPDDYSRVREFYQKAIASINESLTAASK